MIIWAIGPSNWAIVNIHHGNGLRKSIQSSYCIYIYMQNQIQKSRRRNRPRRRKPRSSHQDGNPPIRERVEKSPRLAQCHEGNVNWSCNLLVHAASQLGPRRISISNNTAALFASSSPAAAAAAAASMSLLLRDRSSSLATSAAGPRLQMASLFLNNSRYREQRIYCRVWALRASRAVRPTLVTPVFSPCHERASLLARIYISTVATSLARTFSFSRYLAPSGKDERFMPRCMYNAPRTRRYHLITASVLGNWSSTISAGAGEYEWDSSFTRDKRCSPLYYATGEIFSREKESRRSSSARGIDHPSFSFALFHSPVHGLEISRNNYIEGFARSTNVPETRRSIRNVSGMRSIPI